MTASEIILQKALVGSNLDSSQWNQIQAGFRNRAFISSRVAKVNILDAMRRKAAEYAEGGADLSKIRMEFREELKTLHYDPKGAKGIQNLLSQSRIDVIVKTNVAQARGYMQYAEGMTPGAFAAFPAQEFTRVAHRRQQRKDWPQRWKKAGGKTYGGKMIALKDDPVWERLSVFGNPFPPFDWGSGMGVLDVDRKTAIRLGLVSDEELRGKTAALREKPTPGFNDNLQATFPVSAEHYSQTKAILGKDFGDLVKIDNGVLKWRPEVLEETVLHGKNFDIQLGKPQSGMLNLLRSNPKTAPFADVIEGEQLHVDQTWRDTKRPDGTTHDSHFYPNPEHPEDIPLKPEEMEMLPCMWRKPDRVMKLGADLFLAETDAFDGSTYMMQVKITKKGHPKLWTFFKTTLPTSKKMVRYPATPPPDAGTNRRA